MLLFPFPFPSSAAAAAAAAAGDATATAADIAAIITNNDDESCNSKSFTGFTFFRIILYLELIL